MKIFRSLLILFAVLVTNLYGMQINDHINGDTLTLKGRIIKADMQNENGVKIEGQKDFYFSSGSNSYFIKTASGNFKKEDLDPMELKEITIKCVKKFGNTDIGPNQDPKWSGNRVGEYIVILEILT